MGVAFQTIGMIGSFVIASSLVPQMLKVYKTKSAKDISLRFQLLYCFGIGLILVYGFGENLWPIYIPATVEEVAGLIMLAMKLYYDRSATKPGTSGADNEGHALEMGASPLTRRSETKFTGVYFTQKFAGLYVIGLAFNILGLVGSFMISASLVPQIIKVIRTKSAKDLSRSFQLLYVAGLILVAIYGIGESLWPIWIPVVIELAGGLTLLALKCIYDGHEASEGLDLETGAPERGSTTSYKYALTPK
ncbi:unnamed protein product [Phytophthora fragariaefolia]|uniref:Unnamed protein product n=1 Tax=Phytophthora fragariaefolia TaxID=1490495 RepID=A0A9W6U4W7_9STRA|nr:unnamed protein product [Phytophthora fragariaefolia]